MLSDQVVKGLIRARIVEKERKTKGHKICRMKENETLDVKTGSFEQLHMKV